MRIVVDRALCQTHGQCCFVAPEVFEIGDDDVMHYIERPDDSLRAVVEEAVQFCPEAAISIVED